YSSRARRPDRAFERRGFSEGKISEGGPARNLHCLGDRLEKVKEYFAAQSSIEGVYLFGSFGTSLETPLSDIDFGLIFAEGEEDKGLWELLEIEGALSLLLEREKVDVVNLNTAPAAVRFAAISEGDLVFARDPGRVEDFREQTIDYYLDYQPVLAKMYRDYEEHLREGSSSAKWGD
ncbi:MAG: nucleotidyltransferase domain-containing protein, partial [Bacillota bacterium]|nr:nucleotidyltransferase domain-containing protein [Bacillota bacterium]